MSNASPNPNKNDASPSGSGDSDFLPLPNLEGVPTPQTDAQTGFPSTDAFALPDLSQSIDINFDGELAGVLNPSGAALQGFKAASASPYFSGISESVRSGTFVDMSATQIMDAASVPKPIGRVLLLSTDLEERMYLRARLALSKLVWVDEVASVAQAQAAMKTHQYVLAIFNLDDLNLPILDLANDFKKKNPLSVRLATTSMNGGHRLNLLAQWRRWNLLRRLDTMGFQEILPKPLQPQRLALWFGRINQED